MIFLCFMLLTRCVESNVHKQDNVRPTTNTISQLLIFRKGIVDREVEVLNIQEDTLYDMATKVPNGNPF